MLIIDLHIFYSYNYLNAHNYIVIIILNIDKCCVCKYKCLAAVIYLQIHVLIYVVIFCERYIKQYICNNLNHTAHSFNIVLLN